MPHDITPVNAAIRDQAQKQALDLNGFDYNAPAELFPLRNKRVATHARYRRFDTAAEAVRFAIEDVPAPALNGAYLELTRHGSAFKKSGICTTTLRFRCRALDE